MGKKKLFNDPIYGLISFPYEILYELIDHPYFQRLRRIGQTGMAHYVYPGAHHTRFQHALGALHLMTRALTTLEGKGVTITEDEKEAACIAILLHDIGHGPYSHALEGQLIDLHHEKISETYMDLLNDEFEGRLSLAISIFKGLYHKRYLHQLVSGQLDMDRMDYLVRDSYYTGVAEGVIGYDRLIMMLFVHDGELVVEEKGIYSIEKFLMARRLMYWQVYLHKTALSVEQMLILLVKRVKYLDEKNIKFSASKGLQKLFKYRKSLKGNLLINNELIEIFSRLDDIDIFDLIKSNVDHEDYILSYMCQCLIKRQLFKLSLKPQKVQSIEIQKIIKSVSQKLNLDSNESEKLVITGYESNQMYNTTKNEIKILKKSGEVVTFSKSSDLKFSKEITGRYYICHPEI